MKNGTNIRPRPNWRELLETFQFHQIVAYADERQQDIFVDWTEQDKEELRTTLRYESALLDEAADFLHTDEAHYAVLRLGSLLGTVESFDRVLFEQAQDQWAQAVFEKEAYQVKHLSEVVQALETHGSMFHAELGEYLHIKPPTLTEAMKKVLATGAVQASAFGKYKMYSLTDSGLRYGRELRKQQQNGAQINQAFQILQEFFKCTNSLAELENVRARMHALLHERLSLEIHVDDTFELTYYSTPDKSIVSQEFTVHGITNENRPSLMGTMTPRPSKKQKKYSIKNNDFAGEERPA